MPSPVSTIWRSLTEFTAFILSRSSAARSKFSSSAAFSISSLREPMSPEVLPCNMSTALSTAL